MTIYVVKRGDSLFRIAQRFGTSINSIAELNQLQNPAVLAVGQALLVPSAEQGRVERSVIVNGYVTNASDATLEATLPYLTFLSPFSYRTDSFGTLTPTFDVNTDLSKAYSTENLLTLTNLKERGGFSSAVAHSILTQQDAQDNFIQNVTDLLETGDWYGVNLDFEYVYPFDVGSYNQFLRRFAKVLHSMGYLLVTALAPKISADQSGLLYTAHDYAVHGEVADYVVLMTYEWGYTYGPAMAVAPVNQVRKVLDYAVSVMPAGKILLGVPNYGYDWTLPFRQGTAAKPLSNIAATTLAGTVGAEIKFSQSAQSPFFNYRDSEGRRHEVWFEDARSLRAKYALVEQYGLAGVSYWNLNTFYRTNFAVLEMLFSVEKYQ